MVRGHTYVQAATTAAAAARGLPSPAKRERLSSDGDGGDATVTKVARTPPVATQPRRECASYRSLHPAMMRLAYSAPVVARHGSLESWHSAYVRLYVRAATRRHIASLPLQLCPRCRCVAVVTRWHSRAMTTVGTAWCLRCSAQQVVERSTGDVPLMGGGVMPGQ
jgi:hypothetical protein